MTESIVNEEPATPPTVPRFVRALNSVAESAGFTTDVHVGRIWAHDPGPYLISIWRGSREAFSRLNFLPANVHARFHTNTKGGKICWPSWQGTALLYGAVSCSAAGVEFHLQEEIPKTVRVAGELEEIQYNDRTAYHGARAALIAAGVCSSAQFPEKHSIKRYAENSGERARKTHWSTQRQLDGLYIHSIETEESRLRRVAKLEQYAAQWKVDTSSAPAEIEFKSAADYRDLLVDFTLRFWFALSRQIGHNGPAGPFCYSREAIEALTAGMCDVYHALLEGQVETVREPLDRDRMKAVQMAQSDAKFQHFIQAAAGKPSSGLQ